MWILCLIITIIIHRVISVGCNGSPYEIIISLWSNLCFLPRSRYCRQGIRVLSPSLPSAFSPPDLPVVTKYSSLFLLKTCPNNLDCLRAIYLINLRFSSGSARAASVVFFFFFQSVHYVLFIFFKKNRISWLWLPDWNSWTGRIQLFTFFNLTYINNFSLNLSFVWSSVSVGCQIDWAW